MFIKFIKIYWPWVLATIFATSIPLAAVIFLPALGLLRWILLPIVALIIVTPFMHYNHWRKKELATSEPEISSTGRIVPKMGEIYDFPIGPHPAKMRINKVFEGIADTIEVDVLVILPSGAEFVSLQRIAIDSSNIADCPFMVVFKEGNKFSTWSWDWPTGAIYPVSDDHFWKIEVNEIEVQETI